MFAVPLSSKLPPFDLTGAETHAAGERFDLPPDELEEFRVALAPHVFSFLGAQEHQFLPILVEICWLGRRHDVNAA